MPGQIGDLTACEKLDLSGNNISGDIPWQIENMAVVTSLNLSNNRLTSPLPDMTIMDNLIYLLLSNNDFTGSIPGAVAGIKNLILLDLSHNRFTSTIPLGFTNLKTLNTLRLNDNQMSGELPVASLMGMESLAGLFLSNNEFEEPIPGSIGELTSLAFLWLDGNALTGVPEEINNLTNLVSLYLNDNDIENLPNLIQFPALGYLHLAGNRLTFEDILPNLDAGTVVNYTAQDSVGDAEAYFVEYGKSIRFGSEVGGDGNVYEWYKDGVRIPDAAHWEYELLDATQADSGGQFIMKINNPQAPLLTLTARPITIMTLKSIFDQKTTDNSIRVAVVSIDGPVLYRTPGTTWKEFTQIGQVLPLGTVLCLGPTAVIQVIRSDNARIRLDGGTIRIGTLQKIDKNRIDLFLATGKLESQIKIREAVSSDFSVSTPIATAAVRGTYFSVQHDSITSQTTVRVSEGRVLVKDVGYGADEGSLWKQADADSIELTPWQQIAVNEAGLGTVEEITLTQLEIPEDSVVIDAGQKHWFSARGTDTNGHTLPVKVIWETDGGSIDTTGLLTAGSAGGVFTVTATEPAFGLQASRQYTVVEGPTGIKSENKGQIDGFSLAQNYPNPFNPTTTIHYALPKESHVSLNIFNLLGKQVAELVNESKTAGSYSVRFDASTLASGLYLYKIQMGGYTAVRKMVLLD